MLVENCIKVFTEEKGSWLYLAPKGRAFKDNKEVKIYFQSPAREHGIMCVTDNQYYLYSLTLKLGLKFYFFLLLNPEVLLNPVLPKASTYIAKWTLLAMIKLHAAPPPPHTHTHSEQTTYLLRHLANANVKETDKTVRQRNSYIRKYSCHCR